MCRVIPKSSEVDAVLLGISLLFSIRRNGLGFMCMLGCRDPKITRRDGQQRDESPRDEEEGLLSLLLILLAPSFLLSF